MYLCFFCFVIVNNWKIWIIKICSSLLFILRINNMLKRCSFLSKFKTGTIEKFLNEQFLFTGFILWVSNFVTGASFSTHSQITAEKELSKSRAPGESWKHLNWRKHPYILTKLQLSNYYERTCARLSDLVKVTEDSVSDFSEAGLNCGNINYTVQCSTYVR